MPQGLRTLRVKKDQKRGCELWEWALADRTVSGLWIQAQLRQQHRQQYEQRSPTRKSKANQCKFSSIESASPFTRSFQKAREWLRSSPKSPTKLNSMSSSWVFNTKQSAWLLSHHPKVPFSDPRTNKEPGFDSEKGHVRAHTEAPQMSRTFHINPSHNQSVETVRCLLAGFNCLNSITGFRSGQTLVEATRLQATGWNIRLVSFLRSTRLPWRTVHHSQTRIDNN